MKRAVTLLTIAKESGFHYSTVSLALRGDPRINIETRQLIQKVAEELGYRPDPMLKALSVYRQSIKTQHYQATIAWLTNSRTPQTQLPGYIFRNYVEGANARAQQLGYKIEEFVLREPGISPQRLQSILKARGVDGLLVAPLPGPRAHGRINMDWSLFHAVSFGYSLTWPPLHRITSHHASDAKVAVRKLISLGYRRIGIAIDKVSNDRGDGNWLGGYVSCIMTRQLTPYVFLRQGSGSSQNLLTEEDTSAMRTWIRENRLDAVIFDYSPPFVEWLRGPGGLRVPEDIGVVSLNVQKDDEVHSGIDQNEWHIGWYAMDTLVNMINTHERGIPTVAHKLLIDGTWRIGRTVHRVNARNAV